jgi:hypothetical protein
LTLGTAESPTRAVQDHPQAERDAQILARIDEGVTFRVVASEFGISRARVGQIVRAEQERDEALRLRHRHALELAPHVSEEERFESSSPSSPRAGPSLRRAEPLCSRSSQE